MNFITRERTTLEYCGQQLDPDGIQDRYATNQLVVLAQALLAERYDDDCVALVTFLEPGDATRYALTIIPRGDSVLVARHRGGAASGDFTGAVSLNWRTPLVTSDDLGALGNGNTWTCTVLAWWLAQLFHEMQQANTR